MTIVKLFPPPAWIWTRQAIPKASEISLQAANAPDALHAVHHHHKNHHHQQQNPNQPSRPQPPPQKSNRTTSMDAYIGRNAMRLDADITEMKIRHTNHADRPSPLVTIMTKKVTRSFNVWTSRRENSSNVWHQNHQLPPPSFVLTAGQ